MFSIFRKNKVKIEIPDWACFFNIDEYNTFLKAIENYFYSKNVTYTIGDGALETGPNDFGFDILGLVNVAQVCKFEENRDYNKIVSDHFEALISTKLFNNDFKTIIHDFEQIKEYIAVRLYPSDYIPEFARDETLQRRFAGNLIAWLVFDLPDCITSIHSDDANKWNKTLDELFETGINNVKNKYTSNISEQPLGDFNIWFVQADHFFTANIVFDFEYHQELIGTNGSLIGIPHRHAVIIYPIENIQVVEAINALIPTVRGMNEEGPGSLSTDIFWYKDGHFENLPYEITGDKIQFYPTKGFMNILDSLGLDEQS